MWKIFRHGCEFKRAVVQKRQATSSSASSASRQAAALLGDFIYLPSPFSASGLCGSNHLPELFQQFGAAGVSVDIEKPGKLPEGIQHSGLLLRRQEQGLDYDRWTRRDDSLKFLQYTFRVRQIRYDKPGHES